MTTFIHLTPFVAGLWLIATTYMVNTKGFVSILLYQIIPSFLGLACIFSGCKLMGWIA